MTIEEAIKQTKPFRSSHHRAVVNLIYTHNWLVDQIKVQLKPHKITMQQYNVLRILRGAPNPISTSDIRDRLLDKMADTSRMVERLHQKGLVIRTECNYDKRLVDISLSDKGEQLMQHLDSFNSKIDDVLSPLTAEEAATLSQLLDKARG
ncbi:MAG: MarR family transcriptional regulator [Chitinophagales bacterium]|nr:MarR family transcriptional regulator [Chitinophagales bacterium]